MTTTNQLVIPNEERYLAQNEPLPKFAIERGFAGHARAGAIVSLSEVSADSNRQTWATEFATLWDFI
jgi:hypothetical protein